MVNGKGRPIKNALIFRAFFMLDKYKESLGYRINIILLAVV